MTEELNDIAELLKKPIPSRTTSDESSHSDQWSDTEILERIKTAPMHPDAIWTNVVGTHCSIRVLSSDTVVKWRSSDDTLFSEALALNFVRSHTSIPVPKVRRLLTSECTSYLVLEKIEGQPLDKLWPRLSPLQRFSVACILRGYIRELHKASVCYPRRHIPGPMGDSPQRCHGAEWLFGHRPHGPFNSSTELIDHFSRSYGSLNFDNSQPMVLTHCDLTLRNMIMGQDGKIWLVDWEWSGFYPPWFEFISTMSASENDRFKALACWWRHIPLVTGVWLKEKAIFGNGEWQTLSWLRELTAMDNTSI